MKMKRRDHGQWNRQTVCAVVGMACAALLTIGIGRALADPILVHQSRGDYYSTGGTLVSGCMGLGCAGSTFSFGNTSGTVQWEAVDRVFTDAVAGTTKFTYAVLNDALPLNISSFSIANNGLLGTGTAPAGWVFTQNESYWTWQTATPLLTGITQTGSVGGFAVNLTGNVPVNFNLTRINLSDGLTTMELNSNKWLGGGPGIPGIPIGPVPEPASLLLLGSGLAGFGAWRRANRGRSD